ncbi:MAG: non-canonical purine NTP pyrophosphatase [Candidatus Krumholzibacteriia bacterium]
MTNRSRILVLASRNADKLRELGQLCAGLPFEVRSSLDYPGLPEVIEDGTSALGNATRKALVTAAWTGEIAVADDTTFQVRTLGGMPDVFASRFAGPRATYRDNVDLVLDLMRDVPDDARDVRFETSMVWVDPQPPVAPHLAELTPGRSRWVHDPFASRVVSAAAAARVAAARRRVWADYLAWFGTLPVGWGADARRLEQVVYELVSANLEGPAPTAGGVSVPDVREFTADGPGDQAPPPLAVALPGEAPGRGRTAPVWLELSTEGRLLGRLGRQPLGQSGFGYDPVVVPEGEVRTLAELAPDEKNAISHRGRALRRLLGVVARVYDLTASVAVR